MQRSDKLTIWKFELEVTDEQQIKMPADAEILSVQAQGQSICLWAKVDKTPSIELRSFYVLGTGHPFPVDQYTELKFVGTVQLFDGAAVFHIFEEVAKA